MKIRPLILWMFFFVAILGCTKSGPVLNLPPKVDAGPSQTIKLPVNSVTLSGSATDVDGTVVAYLWSQVAGPDATVITNPGSPTTTVKGFIAGDYIFQFVVFDNSGTTGVDTLSVKVLPP